jgi:hypothetical protein
MRKHFLKRKAGKVGRLYRAECLRKAADFLAQPADHGAPDPDSLRRTMPPEMLRLWPDETATGAANLPGQAPHEPVAAA